MSRPFTALTSHTTVRSPGLPGGLVRVDVLLGQAGRRELRVNVAVEPARTGVARVRPHRRGTRPRPGRQGERGEHLGIVRARTGQHGDLEGVRPRVDALAGLQPEHRGRAVGDHRLVPEPVRDHGEDPHGHPDQGDKPEDDADHGERADIPAALLGIPVRLGCPPSRLATTGSATTGSATAGSATTGSATAAIGSAGTVPLGSAPTGSASSASASAAARSSSAGAACGGTAPAGTTPVRAAFSSVSSTAWVGAASAVSASAACGSASSAPGPPGLHRFARKLLVHPRRRNHPPSITRSVRHGQPRYAGALVGRRTTKITRCALSRLLPTYLITTHRAKSHPGCPAGQHRSTSAAATARTPRRQ